MARRENPPSPKPSPDGRRVDGAAGSSTRRLAELIATGFGSGFTPLAPATFASAVAGVGYWFLPFDGRSPWFFALIAVTLVIGTWATNVIQSKADHDPRRAVIDEFAGMWVTAAFLDKTWPWLLASFFVFRVLDIFKPWPIRKFEGLPGGLGIMADDLAAGIIGAAILNAVRLVFFA